MMDSFSQRVFDNVERRSKAYHLSSGANNILCDDSNDELFTDNKEKENLLTMNSSVTTKHIDDSDFDTEGNISTILTERNDDSENIECGKLEIIYANSNVSNRTEGENTLNNNAVPSGRKPALPPKPSSRIGTASLSILKPKKGLVQSARAVFFDKNPLLKSPPGKRDPAEMSLKERLALFEKNKGSALIPKAPLAMSVSRKQIPCDSSSGNDQAKEPLLNSFILKSVIVQQNSNSKVSIISDQSIEQHSTTVFSSGGDLMDPKEQTIDSRYNSFKCQLTDVIDSLDRSISPPVPTRTTESIKVESHIEAKCSINNKRRNGEIVIDNRLHIHKNDVKCAKTYQTTFGNKLYGDLTPIVTTVAPAKRPDETIGLNELHQTDPDRSLLNNDMNYNQQSKDEDRWEKLIECLLFFCCVA